MTHLFYLAAAVVGAAVALVLILFSILEMLT